MAPLVCTRNEIRSHRRLLVGALQLTLPGPGGSYTARATTDDLEANLVLQGSGEPEYAFRRGGVPIPIVPMLEATPDHPSPYWLAWHEGWRSPQLRPGVRSRKEALQFRTSSVSVYHGDPGGPKRQVLRGEWAGAEVSAAGEVVFQGRGAAHPHWHYAGLVADDDPVGGTAPVAVDPAPGGVGPIDFEPDGSPAIFQGGAPDDRRDAMWASVHLAASARWAQSEWAGGLGAEGTHAFDPVDCDEIRRWIVSCVRYLQSELQGQLLRGA